jgi:hypothetical protein
MNRPVVPRLGRAAAFAAGALLLVLSFSSSALAAERVTFRLLGSSPIYANAVDVHKAAGGTVRVRPARYHYRITTSASAGTGSVTTEASGNCVDLNHYIVTGRDYNVDLQTAADAPELATAPYREAAWLLSRADDLIAAAPDAGLEAGALQLAIWQLTGQARDLDAPSSDVTLNARVSALRALAAGRSVPSALAVSVAGGDTCLDTGAAVTVTGTPGAVVDLAVATAPGAEPTAQVSPQQVTIGADGLASASLRSSAVGAVTVQATTSAPTLIRAAKVQGATTPQDQLFLRPGTLSALATQNFIDCDLYLFAPGAPGATIPLAPPAPETPAAPLAPAGPALVISLDSPSLAAPGGEAVYRLTVTNNGTGTKRGLKVAQRVGAGVSPVSARGPKGSRATVGRSAAHWTLPALKGGRSATLVLRVKVARRLAGEVTRSTAALRGARSASASTAIVRKVGKTEQGF